MSFNINSNIPALNSNHNLSLNSSATTKSLAALSSGSKLNSAADNAAALMIANNFSSIVSGMGQSIMNKNESVGMIQTADGAMQGISDNTDKMRDLTIQASNGALNAGNRASIQKEIDGLMKSSNQIANTTSFNGNHLLDGSQTGSTSSDARMSSLFSSPVNVTSQESAIASLDSIDAGRARIGNIRSSFGAAQNQLESDIRNTSVGQINAAAAKSQMSDVDFASESANFSKANMMSQIGSFVQSQSNASTSNVMRLLQ